MSKVSMGLLIWAVLILALICLAVSGCTTSAVTQCLPLRTWSYADQQQLLKDYQALPAGAQMKVAFQDYMALRNADRACIEAKP